MCFFMCLAIYLFFLKYILHSWHCIALNGILQINEHIYEVKCQVCGSGFKMKQKIKKKTFAKKTIKFLVPSQWYKVSRYILLNSNIPKSTIVFRYREQRYIAPNYLDEDSPFTCVQGSFTNSYNCKWLSFI